jgi:SAM-dependent methyltransferase
MKELLIGCGADHSKKIFFEGDREWAGELVTLDNNADHHPDIVHDLNEHPLPFNDDTFDSIHAYEVLEHLAYIGDYRFFFEEFSEYWRILKPGGHFYATVPALDSPWLFGDPSHTRVICQEQMIFLSQKAYVEQVGKTPMSDFRYLYKADFDLVDAKSENLTFMFVLQAIKPSTLRDPE